MTDYYSLVVDVERSVIARVIKDPIVLSDADGLHWWVFSTTIHQTIFRAIENLVAKGVSPDYATILDLISTENQRDTKIFSDYLRQIINIESDFDFKDYVNIIIKNYKTRSMMSLLSESEERIKSGEDSDKIISDLIDRATDITNLGQEIKIKQFNDIIRDAYEDVKRKALSDSDTVGWTTGIRSVDLTTSGMNPGELWIIAGRPGTGKSALFCNFAINQAMQGIPVGYISLEMRSLLVARRMLSIVSGVPNEKLKFGSVSPQDVKLIEEAITKLKSIPLYIDENFYHDEKSFPKIIKQMVNKHRVKVIYVDYVQLLAERDGEATQQLGRITRTAKLLANGLGITIVIGSQLNRLVESRVDKHPILSDLRQAGYLEEDADLVIGLYRDVLYNPRTKYPDLLEFCFLKSREGSLGRLPLNFDTKTYKITEGSTT